MKLSIDTSDRKVVRVGIDGEIFEETAKAGSSQRTLQFINEVLDKKGLQLTDISEISVETGPGSYTGLRVGSTIAQVMGWSLGVKVNGKDIKKGEFIKLKYK